MNISPVKTAATSNKLALLPVLPSSLSVRPISKMAAQVAVEVAVNSELKFRCTAKADLSHLTQSFKDKTTLSFQISVCLKTFWQKRDFLSSY